jgi:hypothetical protein
MCLHLVFARAGQDDSARHFEDLVPPALSEIPALRPSKTILSDTECSVPLVNYSGKKMKNIEYAAASLAKRGRT